MGRGRRLCKVVVTLCAALVALLLLQWHTGLQPHALLRDVVRCTYTPQTQVYSNTGTRCELSNDPPPATVTRDVTWSEDWPERQINVNHALEFQVVPVVHYLWCGKKKELTFQHYLGLLSALRVLKPVKVFFHFAKGEPAKGDTLYNSWFQEFQQAVSIMDTVQVKSKANCGSRELLTAVLQQVATDGGVYLGERVILTQVPPAIPQEDSWFASAGDKADVTRAIVYMKGSAGVNVTSLVNKIVTAPAGCVTVDKFTGQQWKEEECVVLDKSPKYPRDIWAADTTFGELARWLFYGRRAPFHVSRDPSRPIPRVSHFVRIYKAKGLYSDMPFSQYISILSSLYVGGFERVYLHVDQEPKGEWWERLKKEKVTVVKLPKPTMVFGQSMSAAQHQSDIYRFNAIYRYGGAYQDFDCVWTNRVPDHLLEFPMVIAPAIGRVGNWPDGLAAGMFMARPGAPFLRQIIKNYRHYYRSVYLFNAIMLPYRSYEHYPDAIRVDPHFTVFCLNWGCTPRWESAKDWKFKDNGARDQDWRGQTLALHVVQPKPSPSLVSPAALKASTDLVGEVGRNVLRLSGQLHLLDHVD